AKIKRKDLCEGEGYSDVPERVMRQVNRGEEEVVHVRRTEPVTRQLTRHIPADVVDQADSEMERLAGILGGHRRIRTARARFQPTRRVVDVAADREGVFHNLVSEFSVDFPEIRIVERGVSVRECRKRRSVGSSWRTKVPHFLRVIVINE